MAWGRVMDAITLVDSTGQGSGPIVTTSTSAAVRASLGMAPEVLRIFPISDKTFRESLRQRGVGPEWKRKRRGWGDFDKPPTDQADAANWRRCIGRFQALRIPETAGEYDLTIEGGSPQPRVFGHFMPAAALVASGVPEQYTDPILAFYEAVEKVFLMAKAGVPRYSASIHLRPGWFYVIFKDADVIEIPQAAGGGWLMIVARYRIPVFDADGNVIAYSGALGSATTASQSAGDIVAFYAKDPGFTEDVRGLYLLVDSLEAVRGNQAFRLWLGAPSGVFATDPSTGRPSLFVYYVIESNLKEPSTTPPLDRSVDAAAWRAAENEWAGGDFAMEGRGIAVKRFDASAVRSEIVHRAAITESLWTRGAAVDGELLGRVRVKVAAGKKRSGRYPVRTFENQFPAGGAPPLKVDPDSFTCKKGLHLVFCARERNYPDDYGSDASSALVDGTNGHGLWHTVGFADGVRIIDVDTGRTETTVFGRDFVMRAVS